MSSRKYIRLALTEEDIAFFKSAKQEAEIATGVAMSDSMFALSVIRQALKKRSR